jgi:hypothetical protein
MMEEIETLLKSENILFANGYIEKYEGSFCVVFRNQNEDAFLLETSLN